MRFLLEIERLRQWVHGIDRTEKESSQGGLLLDLIKTRQWDGVLKRIETRKGKKELQKIAVIPSIIKLDAPFELLVEILEQYPEAAKVTDEFGNLPLHYMWHHDHYTYLSPHVVRLLLDAHPDGVKATNKYGQLPLHIAALNNAPLESLDILLDAHPEGAAKICEAVGTLPIHYLENFASCLPIHYLAKRASPDRREDVEKVKALLVPILDDEEACKVIHPYSGKTPLHIAADFDALPLRTYVAIECCPPDVIMAVARHHPEQLRVRDAGDGNLPLHVAAANASLNGAESRIGNYEDEGGSGNERTVERNEPNANGSRHATNDRRIKKDLISKMLKLYPEAAALSNGKHRFPLCLAIESGKRWHQGVEAISDAAGKVITITDEHTNLFPFMLAATVDNPCITTVYSLLRRCPEFERYVID